MIVPKDQQSKGLLGERELLRNDCIRVVINITITTISPAQGAMFAPLALKFVYSDLSIFLCLTILPLAGLQFSR